MDSASNEEQLAALTATLFFKYDPNKAHVTRDQLGT